MAVHVASDSLHCCVQVLPWSVGSGSRSLHGSEEAFLVKYTHHELRKVEYGMRRKTVAA